MFATSNIIIIFILANNVQPVSNVLTQDNLG